MKQWILFLILLMPLTAQATLTKIATTEALVWTKVTAASGTSGIIETGSITISDSYATTIHVDVCIADTDAHEGTEVIVMIAASTTGNNSWTTLSRVITNAETATNTILASAEAAGETTLSCGNLAGQEFNHVGKHVFIESPTSTNCEIAYLIDSEQSGNTLTLLNGLLHEQAATTSKIWTVDGDGDDNSAVWTRPFAIPFSISSARVIINNFYDNDGTAADVYARVRVTEVTGL